MSPVGRRIHQNEIQKQARFRPPPRPRITPLFSEYEEEDEDEDDEIEPNFWAVLQRWGTIHDPG